MKMVNKKYFIEKYANLRGITKTAASVEVNAFLEVLEDVIVEDEGVNFVGFGKFEIVEVPEHIGVNPRTQEPMTIPKNLRVKFTAGKILKDKINGR